ncbi:hypothetical protein [Candidatus Protochlamydia sp. R18]|uniref:hypothetical protein n=1 Tax=Candidatus Protochlamydia sp. R18 TaxID=1353977 RepID=UPI0005A623A8|nr:hypothetical protein [Candidatus Protochlamydia sp. R18]
MMMQTTGDRPTVFINSDFFKETIRSTNNEIIDKITPIVQESLKQSADLAFDKSRELTGNVSKEKVKASCPIVATQVNQIVDATSIVIANKSKELSNTVIDSTTPKIAKASKEGCNKCSDSTVDSVKGLFPWFS